MKKAAIFCAALFLGFYIFSGQVWAEDGKIRVKLEVLGDQNVDRDADKFMRTALGALGNVELVEDNPQVYLHVMTRRIVTNTGRRIGYVMATASAQILEIDLKDGLPFVCSDYSGLWLETGPDLRGLCEKCVMAVDYGVFGRVRKALEARPAEMPVTDAGPGEGGNT